MILLTTDFKPFYDKRFHILFDENFHIIIHFTIFFFVTSALYYLFKFKPIIITLAFIISIGGEYIQHFSPERSVSLKDYVANVLGFLLATYLFSEIKNK
ncbi:MAG: VanZ family protein [Saprospiraceae bacterium]